MKFTVLKLELALMLLQFGIDWLALKVWMRETAYHKLAMFTRNTALVLAFDKNDPEFKAAVAEAVAEATDGLKAKRDELIAEVRQLKRGKEVDPAEVTRLEGEIDKLRGDLADANKALKVANTTAEKATKDLASEQSFTQRLVVENALVAELTAAGVPAGPLLKGALAMMKQEKIEVTVDGENRVALLGGKPIAEAVKAWAAGDDGKQYVAAPGNTGGGATGGKTGPAGIANPWAKETFNLTKQGELITQNPAQAKALAAEAGATI